MSPIGPAAPTYPAGRGVTTGALLMLLCSTLHATPRDADSTHSWIKSLTGDRQHDSGIIQEHLQDREAPALDLPAGLTILKVGADGACQHGTIQAAIDAAPAPPATTLIHIARNVSYTQQALTIHNKDLVLIGGFATCAAQNPDLPNTILDGAGGLQAPVLRIINTEPERLMRVLLSRLTLQGGDPAGSGFCDQGGGGMRITGRTRVQLESTFVRNNLSPCDGGGILVNGHSFADSLLLITAGSGVVNNEANYRGGGITCMRGRLELAHWQVTVGLNRTLLGNGGGISLDRCVFSSSAGGPFTGIFANESNGPNGGGGISAVRSSLIFAKHPDSDRGPEIFNNTANTAAGSGRGGGGLYLFASSLNARELAVFGNQATAAGSIGGGVLAITGAFPPSASEILWRRDGPQRCPPTQHCNRVSGNRAGAAGGAIAIVGREGVPSRADIRQIEIHGNQADHGSALYVAGGVLDLQGALITGNLPGTSLSEPIWLLDGASALLAHATIADNPGHAFTVRNDGGAFVLLSSVVSEFFSETLTLKNGGTTAWRCLLVSELGSIPQPNSSVLHWPHAGRAQLFRTPDQGDYRLRAGSPALDFCDGFGANFPLDMHFTPRGFDIPELPNRPGFASGPYDLGAFELEFGYKIFDDRFEEPGLKPRK